MEILFCTTILPFQKSTGSEVISQAFVNTLGEIAGNITVVGYSRPGQRNLGPDEIMVEERAIETRGSGFRGISWLFQSFVRDQAYSSVKYCSNKYIDILNKLFLLKRFDFVVIDHAQMHFILPHLPLEQKVIFIAHNAESDMYNRLALKKKHIKRWIFKREARLVYQLEKELIERSFATWTFTLEDTMIFKQIYHTNKAKHVVIPGNLKDVRPSRKTPVYDIGLLGTWSWQPNAEGLKWFIQKVLPHLPEDIRIGLAGRGADWVRNCDPRLHYLGFVEDSNEFLNGCRVIAIPSTVGGGIQIKTLEAIALGKPIVLTSTALRGIDSWPGYVAVADTPGSFKNMLLEQLSLSDKKIFHFETEKWIKERQRKFSADLLAQLQRQARGVSHPSKKGNTVVPFHHFVKS